jgi:methylenetetrahydrofolate reductase (NADPH)
MVDEAKVKSYPWLRPAGARRESETVRPIFWSQRSRSYVARTRAWDDFPNGRFGNRDSPAFGEFDYHLYRQTVSIKDAQKEQWAFESLPELQQVFRKFVSRDGVMSLPWCPAAPGDETVCIKKQLVRLNDMGCLTINSQPRVNGCPSNDPMFGWGPKHGVVYQKAYVEFFCSPRRFEQLEKAAAGQPTLEIIAAKASGDVWKNYKEDRRTTAVTWGIFPGQEVQQPTVVDSQSFLAWKDEAFALWAEFEQAVESDEPKKLLKEIREDWYLVSVVDNNFLLGDMFETLLSLGAQDSFLKTHGA